MNVAVTYASMSPSNWWLADTDSPEPYGPVPPIGHEDCRHRVYRLTCRQYDRLLSRAAGQCELCGLRDVDNFRDRLYLDHVTKLGTWSVRGLLCRSCNAGLRSPWDSPRSVAYGENAFYLTLLSEAGVTNLEPAEPDLMSVVMDHAYRPWIRQAEGWWPQVPFHQVTAPETWAGLIFRSGPHNLRPQGVIA